MEIYLSLDEKALNSLKKTAKKRALEQDRDATDELLFPDLKLVYDGEEVDDGEIKVYGDLQSAEKSLGYISVSYTPSLDTIADLITHYVNKLNRLKTVLEAVKKE